MSILTEIYFRLQETIKREEQFKLSIKETKELQRFLYDSGYISHEFHHNIHLLAYRIDEFLKDK